MKISNLGYPRIGRQRELKVALESYFKFEQPQELLQAAEKLCLDRWSRQRDLGVDSIPCNDFSLFDSMLDLSLALGVIPKRFDSQQEWLRLSHSLAHGAGASPGLAVRKWFNTNYHFFVPEIGNFSDPRYEKIQFELGLARKQKDLTFHPVLIGPWTFAKLSTLSGLSFQEALNQLLPRYSALLKHISEAGWEYIQMDEPYLCHDLVREDLRTVRRIYETLCNAGCPLQLATYFGSPEPWLSEIVNLPCHSFHFDLLYWNTTSAWLKTRAFPRTKELSLGIVNGRNVWASPLWDRKEELQGIVDIYGADRIRLAPTCSLMHLPHDKTLEKQWDTEFLSWVCFADQRLEELAFLKRALSGDKSVETLLKQRQASLAARLVSTRVHRSEVKQAVARIEAQQSARGNAPAIRAKSRSDLKLPVLPITTVGSFPQTSQLRKTRQEWKRGKITQDQYVKAMKEEIEAIIRIQERLGIDVLVHGEVERSDMVEYFAEHWDGVATSAHGWVQSLGTRFVKPPLIYGDIRRRSQATVEWFTYAQGLTAKPVKAILTGPVTLLNWSYVRDDQARHKTAFQIALALREEASDLEKAGVRILQVDEAALREGLPMMHAHWAQYLRWAVEAFHLVAGAVSPKVQVHVHVCYSEFSDIVDTLAILGCDVLLIESARGGEDVLKKLKKAGYSRAIGPGVIDVHSHAIPDSESCERWIEKWLKLFPAEQLWINPDCGLKAMGVEQAQQALAAMVSAVDRVREKLKTVRKAS